MLLTGNDHPPHRAKAVRWRLAGMALSLAQSVIAVALVAWFARTAFTDVSLATPLGWAVVATLLLAGAEIARRIARSADHSIIPSLAVPPTWLDVLFAVTRAAIMIGGGLYIARLTDARPEGVAAVLTLGAGTLAAWTVATLARFTTRNVHWWWRLRPVSAIEAVVWIALALTVAPASSALVIRYVEWWAMCGVLAALFAIGVRWTWRNRQHVQPTA